jgi:tRNA A-37 threonylcarbamoyl transferase component Bud32
MGRREIASCPRCGTPAISWAGAGLCPVCLLSGARNDPAPTQIGDYDILEELGHGNEGVIYRARHRKIDRVVALKMIRTGRLASDADRERFVAGIQAAATLAHPNIVPIYEVGEHAGSAFFTMPVFRGTLRRQMDCKRADPKVASALVATVARAVHHAHERGVLHRDLKPDNILMDEDGAPHVADFGVAKRLGEQGLTEPGVVIGTRAYMAPEQARGDVAAITTAVDQFSLGIVLYELLTGEPPLATQAGDIEPPSPRARVPTVPRDLEAICLKCIAREPGARYDSVAALAIDLEHFVRGEPPVAGPPNLVARAWRFSRRHRLAVTACAATMILLAMTAASAVLVARAQESSALQANSFAAEALAGEVAFYLQAQLDDVVKLASDPEISSQDGAAGDVAEVWLTRQRDRTRFENLWLLDQAGKPIAVTEPAPVAANRGATPPTDPRPYLRRLYDWRDPFESRRYAGRLHLSRARGGSRRPLQVCRLGTVLRCPRNVARCRRGHHSHQSDRVQQGSSRRARR